MNSQERYSSRKWILHKNTALFISTVATLLIAARLFGSSHAPDVSSTLSFWGLATGGVLAAYSTANLVSQKLNGSSKLE